MFWFNLGFKILISFLKEMWSFVTKMMVVVLIKIGDIPLGQTITNWWFYCDFGNFICAFAW